MTPPAGDQADGPALIRRMAGGDRQAFAAFYDRYADLAFTLIRRILPQPPEAEDVLQEVFWEIWRLAPRYEPERGAPAAWVLTRARSRAIDRLRSVRRRDVEVGVEHIETAPAATSADDPSAGLPDRELVRGAMGTLVPAQREIVELAFFGGMTHTEIAARLSQPLGTVKTRMRSALKHMREQLARTAAEPVT